MAKPSRSKQPDFDPRELEDLIFTPAVGTGVGSHLLRQNPQQLSTVATSAAPLPCQIADDTPSQSHTDMATVVMREPSTVATSAIWRTESGDLVPESRVRRIRLAQDVLNSAEESLYDALWNVKGALKENGDRWRIVQAGYDFLVKRTRLSRKTVQRIVDKLMQKDFIAIERPADIYSRTSTTYRVFSYRTVLERQSAKGRLFAVKIGPGFVFAEKLENNAANVTTVDRLHLSSVVTPTTPTVVKMDVTTVVGPTTPKIEHVLREQSSSSPGTPRPPTTRDDDDGLCDPVIEAAARYGIVLDSEIARRLTASCRANDPSLTGQEMAALLELKINQLRKGRSVENWPALLATAVPKMVPSMELNRLREARSTVGLREREMARDILNDPDATEVEREWARGVLNAYP